MSKEEKWLIDINDRIDTEVDIDIHCLEKLASCYNIELDYILERYRDKVVYKINKLLKHS